jgi:predicted dehydrogenase
MVHRGGEWHQSYVEEWKHFVEAIRTGKTVECGLHDGRHALAIALAAMESAATGMTIRLLSPAQELTRQPSTSLTTTFL